jgi:nicotinamidase-related amidase
MAETRGDAETQSEPRAFDHPALIVWNMQNGILSHAHNTDTLVHNIRELIETARKVEVPIIYSQHHNFPLKWMDPGSRELLQGATAEERGPWMRLGSSEWEIASMLKPEEDDLVLPVHTPSFFLGTPLQHVLGNYNIRTLVLTGVATHSGILVTARQALMLGFAVAVVEDSVGSTTIEQHLDALRILRHSCEVIPTVEAVARFNKHTASTILPPPLLGWQNRERVPGLRGSETRSSNRIGGPVTEKDR